jgi:hypothetical protein
MSPTAEHWIDVPFDGEEETPVPPACVVAAPRNTRKDALAQTLRQRAAALRAEASRLEAIAAEREAR